MAAQPSLLDDLGEEVTGIVAPVSLCMAVTVLLVRMLNPEGISSTNTVIIASIAYQESSSDSSGKKLGGALLNAIIFVGVIAGMTIILFLLFKYKCYKFIYAYMGFAVFNIFFFITGALFIQVMQVIDLHIDAFSLAYGLFNFSVVGTAGLLFLPIPLLAKQGYLIWVGIIVAYIFTFIPEWTAWVILVFMALYDIAAVLIPGGPLNALVNLAIERKQELPALIYEARPAGGRPYVRGWGNRRGNPGDDAAAAPPPGGEDGAAAPGDNPAPRGPGGAPPPPPPLPGAAMSPSGGAGGGTSAPRPVAEGSGSPSSLEMRRTAAADMVVAATPRTSGGPLPPGGMSIAVLPAGGGPEAARRGAAGSGGAGGPTRRISGGAAEGPVEAWGPGGQQMEQLRSFASHQSQDWRPPLPPRRPPAGSGVQGRPLGEGREEGGEWQALPSSAQDQGQADSTLRGRLARVLSGGGGSPRPAGTSPAGAGPGAGGGRGREPDISRVTPSSHTSQEPLIDPQAAALEQDVGDYMEGTDRRGAAGPSNPVGPPGSSRPLQPMPPSRDGGLGGGGGGGSGKAFGGKGAATSYGADVASNGSSSYGGSGTMGVRPVAPAIGSEQLAAAARRNVNNGDAPLTSAPAPMPEPRRTDDPDAPPPGPGGDRSRARDGEDEGEFEVDLPDAIKLGLGDFIFYSMLVGRAAMYDFMTVFSSYLAIIAGLGLTLLCLAVFQKALPALPFSIALGVAFYFLTRLTLEPFLVPLAVNMTFF